VAVAAVEEVAAVEGAAVGGAAGGRWETSTGCNFQVACQDRPLVVSGSLGRTNTDRRRGRDIVSQLHICRMSTGSERKSRVASPADGGRGAGGGGGAGVQGHTVLWPKPPPHGTLEWPLQRKRPRQPSPAHMELFASKQP
jgi:hypothetical protein